ncbi:accessory factor UbiK family protein [Teichococcus rhizosphaerae]|uniref:accessory factor UbiK family protein n=1 Tax=Teichococcus rhizosphaerae TaxID=1335062 RepID=UPI001FEB9805|nr:accessory factor UbiK family protein [Pseudoroseomonas rhizosphaerae]
MESGSESGAGNGPGRRGRLFDDLAGLAGGAFSMVSGLRAEVEAMARSQVEMMVQRLELVRREDLDAALEVARRAREESTALAARVAALEAKLGGGNGGTGSAGGTSEPGAPGAVFGAGSAEGILGAGPTTGASAGASASPAGAAPLTPAPEPTQSAEPPLHAGGPRLADEAADKGGEGAPPAGTEPGRAAGSGGGDSHPAKPL